MSDDLIKRDDALAILSAASGMTQKTLNKIIVLPSVKDDHIEQLAATCEQLEHQLERERVLDDGRPCVTDVFLAAAIEQLDDKWYFFEAVKCWCEGDWVGALEGIELEGEE